MDKASTFHPVLFALALGALCLSTGPASALDAALAKLCRDKSIEAYPPKPAGSSTGHAKAQRDYYNLCLAKQGKMDAEPKPDAATQPDPAKPDPAKKAGGSAGSAPSP
jgi:hypothetical protein